MKEVIVQFSSFQGISAPPNIPHQQRISAILGGKELNMPHFQIISRSLGGVLVVSDQENLQEQLLKGSRLLNSRSQQLDGSSFVGFNFCSLFQPAHLTVTAGWILCPPFTFSALCWNNT